MIRDLTNPVTREEIVKKPTSSLVIIVAKGVDLSDPRREQPLPNMGRAFELACEELDRRISAAPPQRWASGAMSDGVNHPCRRSGCAGKKPSSTEIEDLKKARWYLDREIARREPGK